MSLPARLAARIALPVVCAPMFLISTPALVIAARAAGLIGAFPLQNVRNGTEFAQWLNVIRAAADTWSAENEREPAPLAVNIPTTLPLPEMRAALTRSAAAGVDIVITSVGKPDIITSLAHDLGLLVHHDATSLEFAEKAIEAGVDGLNCIGAGGGGHSGTIAHLAFIPRVREMFDGTISLAGAVSTGAAVRAAEVLGADLAFVGSRFAATAESGADPQQKEWMRAGSSRRLRYSSRINGVPANWMLDSLEHHGIDIDRLPAPAGRGTEHLPGTARPWRDLWSAGQGIDLIHDIPSMQVLAERLRREYLDACESPMRASAVAAWPRRVREDDDDPLHQELLSAQ